MQLRLILTLTACASLSACQSGTISTTADDGSDAAAHPLAGVSAEDACAMLKLGSLASPRVLDEDVRMNNNAARAIASLSAGKDAVRNTDDDVRFTSLEQLDAVKFVGPHALATMLAFVQAPAGEAYRCRDVAVQLLALNDFHGALEPPTGSGGKIKTDAGNPAAIPPVAATEVDAGGAEYLATHIKRYKEQNPNTLVVAAGDCIGATPLLSAAFHDEPSIESLNALGLDIASVGNHEFDEGVFELWRMQEGGVHQDAPDRVRGWDGDGYEGAAFKYLAANAIYEDDGLPVFAPFTVRRFGNARIAFIGMTLEGTPDVVTAAGVQGVRFADEVETANALVPQIRALGIETIVVLLHEGGWATGLYNACDGISGPIFDIATALDPAIDVVVSGHTNAAHVCNIQGRLVTSAAHNGRLLTDIDLVIDEATGNVKTMSAQNLIVTRDVSKDAMQSALIGKWKTLVAPIANRVVASIAADLSKTANAAGESVLGDVVADSQRLASSGAEIAFMNPGGIRTDVLVASIAAAEQPGEVTYAELFSVQPFSNNLVLFTLTGAQIERVLEEQWFDFAKASDRGVKAAVLAVSSGFRYTWDSTKPAGDRVKLDEIFVNGQPLDPMKTYRVVSNVFLAGGGDGFSTFKAGTERLSGVFDLEALEAYMGAHPALAPAALDRITRR